MSNKLFPIIPRRGDLFKVFGNAGDIDSLFSLLDTNPDRSRSFKGFSSFATPRANVFQTDDGFRLDLAAPGFSRSDFDINVKDSVLTISSKEVDEVPDTNENYSSREFTQSSFSRSWTLPESANVDVITARYESGILSLDIPSNQKTSEKLIINVE